MSSRLSKADRMRVRAVGVDGQLQRQKQIPTG
jgi:hypothetical protein